MKKTLLYCVCLTFLAISFTFCSGCTFTKFPDTGMYICEDPYICYISDSETGSTTNMNVNGKVVPVQLSLGFNGAFEITERRFEDNLIEQKDYLLYQGTFNMDMSGNIILKLNDDNEEFVLTKQ